MPTYILQKDLPNLKAGAEFELTGVDTYYSHDADGMPVYFNTKFIYNNVEWFLSKEEKYNVFDIGLESHKYGSKEWKYCIWVNKRINNYKYPLIKEAIERVLNEKIGTEEKQEQIYNWNISKMKESFDAARLGYGLLGYKYDCFNDYLKYLSKDV